MPGASRRPIRRARRRRSDCGLGPARIAPATLTPRRRRARAHRAPTAVVTGPDEGSCNRNQDRRPPQRPRRGAVRFAQRHEQHHDGVARTPKNTARTSAIDAGHSAHPPRPEPVADEPLTTRGERDEPGRGPGWGGLEKTGGRSSILTKQGCRGHRYRPSRGGVGDVCGHATNSTPRHRRRSSTREPPKQPPHLRGVPDAAPQPRTTQPTRTRRDGWPHRPSRRTRRHRASPPPRTRRPITRRTQVLKRPQLFCTPPARTTSRPVCVRWKLLWAQTFGDAVVSVTSDCMAGYEDLPGFGDHALS